MTATTARWNHNLHYHPLILRQVPAGARTALDIGCGDGVLARDLRERVPQVTAIDRHAPSIAQARRSDDGRGVEYVCDDVLTAPLEPGSFDVVVSVATLHHLDAEAGLTRFAELVRPGGRLVVVGLARAASPVDLVVGVAAVPVNAVQVRRRGYWEHDSPQVWPPPETFGGMRRLVGRTLPGARFRRHLYWRWSLVWDRPRTP